jgi:serine-type D-Ala-D-Ala carboxypeptidase/endopeptidase
MNAAALVRLPLLMDVTGMTVRVTSKLLVTLAAVFGAQASRVSAQSTGALDPVSVRGALVPRVNDGTFQGIAAAWSEGDSVMTTAAGVVAEHGAAIDVSTRFEVGEAGEIFVTALLAHLVARGELSLDDLAQGFLPPDLHLPTRLGRAITLGDLAFHRAGLPDVRLTTGQSPADRVARSLRGLSLRSDIGSRYAFSQLGIEILGLALARHLRMPLATAIQVRVLSPLGVPDVAPSFEPRLAARDATGHAANGKAVSLTGGAAGTWRATAVAMTRFAIAASDTSRGPLASTFALMMRSRSVGPDPTLPVALGWRVLRLDGRDIYWHDAQQASGFSTYVALDPSRHRAAAVLSNSARDVDSIAGALLLGRVPRINGAVRTPTPAPVVRSRGRRRGR